MRPGRRVTTLVFAVIVATTPAGCAGPAEESTPVPPVHVDAPLPAVRSRPPAVAAGPVVVEALAPVPPAGNPTGGAEIPPEARAVDTSSPTHVIGTGTPDSCTSQAVVDAVAAGGIITFDCGWAPTTITMEQTAKVVNAHEDVVIDGGGLVTLSGGGERRILYMNACDQAQGWTTSHCNNQEHPQLVVQNITFADGDSTGDLAEGGGGGAIFVRGGRFRVVNSTFVRNRCDPTGTDLGGAALRVFDQHEGRPVYVVSSTFGGAEGDGGVCANGGAISSIGVSWEILNSVMSHNEAIGYGANGPREGEPGGGNGGAIYIDGNTINVRVAGSIIEDNMAVEGGSGIFFVSNDRTGLLTIENSILQRNPRGRFQSQPGIYYLGRTEAPETPGSTIQ